jgi:ribonuclease PH
MRSHNRGPLDARPMEFVRGFTRSPAGSVLVRCGETHVLCTASIVPGVPAWRDASGAGWLTGEYDMLPASTGQRRERNRTRVDGRTQEIQRIIGRALRAAVDMRQLGQNTIYVDCDVLQADGGTRTTAVNGAYVALCDALRVGRERNMWIGEPLRAGVAAVSVGIVASELLVDLDYREDSTASVDANLVMTDRAEWIEVQATGERCGYTDEQLNGMLSAGRRAILKIMEMQRAALENPT